jgi:hypothetical protein
LSLKFLSTVHKKLANYCSINPFIIKNILVGGIQWFFFEIDKHFVDFLSSICLHLFAEDIMRYSDYILFIKYILQCFNNISCIIFVLFVFFNIYLLIRRNKRILYLEFLSELKRESKIRDYYDDYIYFFHIVMQPCIWRNN